MLIAADFVEKEAINNFQPIVMLGESMTGRSHVIKVDKSILEELYNKPMTQQEIAELYGVTQRAIVYYFRKFGISARKNVKLHPVLSGFVVDKSLRYDNLTRVNLDPSYELSYILGVYFGDGTLDHVKKTFQLVAKDKDFVDEFLRCYCKISNKIYTTRPYGKYFRAQPASLQLYQWIKDKEFNQFSEIIDLYPHGFIKGFFDSEGTVDIISKFGRRIRMSNTDLSLLEYVSDLLFNLGINSKIYKENKIGEVVYGKTGKRYVKTKDCYRLHIPAKETPIFTRLISTSIKRKRDILEKI